MWIQCTAVACAIHVWYRRMLCVYVSYVMMYSRQMPHELSSDA
jgi:hypothetical protein